MEYQNQKPKASICSLIIYKVMLIFLIIHAFTKLLKTKTQALEVWKVYLSKLFFKGMYSELYFCFIFAIFLKMLTTFFIESSQFYCEPIKTITKNWRDSKKKLLYSLRNEVSKLKSKIFYEVKLISKLTKNIFINNFA